MKKFFKKSALSSYGIKDRKYLILTKIKNQQPAGKILDSNEPSVIHKCINHNYIYLKNEVNDLIELGLIALSQRAEIKFDNFNPGFFYEVHVTDQGIDYMKKVETEHYAMIKLPEKAIQQSKIAIVISILSLIISVILSIINLLG